MNKYLTLIAKRTERAYLSARILFVRPDLAGKPFGQQLNTYILDTLDRFMDVAEPELPELLDRALGYDADKSAGHYRALYFLYMRKHTELLLENMEQNIEMSETLLDNIGLRKVAREAVDIATNAVGPAVRNN